HVGAVLQDLGPIHVPSAHRSGPDPTGGISRRRCRRRGCGRGGRRQTQQRHVSRQRRRPHAPVWRKVPPDRVEHVQLQRGGLAGGLKLVLSRLVGSGRLGLRRFAGGVETGASTDYGGPCNRGGNRHVRTPTWPSRTSMIASCTSIRLGATIATWGHPAKAALR